MVREFERILEENLEFDRGSPVTPGDTLVAEFLVRKFGHYTCKYIVIDEDENIEGDGKLVFYRRPNRLSTSYVVVSAAPGRALSLANMEI